MSRDIDHIIERLTAELPGVQVAQLQATHPGADDDGFWFIKIPGIDEGVQMESSHGSCPFLIESDLSDDRLYGRNVDEVVQTVSRLYSRKILKREFDAEKGSFLILARIELSWDWDAFRRLTSAMYDVADEVKGRPSVETWIAQGFWFCNDAALHHPSYVLMEPAQGKQKGISLVPCKTIRAYGRDSTISKTIAVGGRVGTTRQRVA